MAPGPDRTATRVLSRISYRFQRPKVQAERGFMTGTSDRILVTHVGSLVRPPKLVEFLRLIEGGQRYDTAAYEACLKDSIALSYSSRL